MICVTIMVLFNYLLIFQMFINYKNYTTKINFVKWAFKSNIRKRHSGLGVQGFLQHPDKLNPMATHDPNPRSDGGGWVEFWALCNVRRPLPLFFDRSLSDPSHGVANSQCPPFLDTTIQRPINDGSHTSVDTCAIEKPRRFRKAKLKMMQIPWVNLEQKIMVVLFVKLPLKIEITTVFERELP